MTSWFTLTLNYSTNVCINVSSVHYIETINLLFSKGNNKAIRQKLDT